MAYQESRRFAQDLNNDEANQRKHGLSFDEASGLFSGDDDYLEIYDEEHSDAENRFIAIGPVRAGIIVAPCLRVADD